HDFFRLHHGRGATGHRQRRGQRIAPRDGRRGVRRDVGGHVVWPVPHAGVLRGHRAGAAPCPARDQRPRPAACSGSVTMKTGLLLLWAGVLVGCAAGPDYHEPQRPLPAHFGNAQYPSLGEGQVAAQFWTLLNDPTLDGLIADALAANNDLARAADNLEASRAAARLVGFDAYPTIRVGGSYSHALASQHQFIGAANATRAQRT